MNILMVCDYLADDIQGGSDRILFEHARGLKKRGHLLKIIAGSEKRYLRNSSFPNDMEICRYRIEKNRFIRLFQTVLGSKKLFDLLSKKIKFNVINFQQPLSACHILFYRKRLKTIFKIYTFHSPWHMEYEAETAAKENAIRGINSILRRRLEKFCLDRCDKIMVLSRYMKKELMRIHGIDEGKIAVIPGGVDTEKFKPASSKREARRRLALPEDKTIILSLRSLIKRKGLFELILAAKPLLQNTDGMVFVIMGDGPRKKALEDFIEALGLGPKVFITGFKKEESVPLYYQAADLCIVPSQVLEGFGLVVLEALSSGTPVLATPVGGIREILTPFDERCLLEDASPASLNKGIERFLGDRETARSIAGKARDYVMREYSWEVIMPRVEKEFMERKPD